MGFLNLSDIKPGMVPAKPVYSSQGLLLLKEGIKLTDKHIRIFKSWGVFQIDIMGVESEDIGLIAQEKLSKEDMVVLEKRVKRKFSGWTEDKAAKEIMRVTKKFMIEDMLQKME